MTATETSLNTNPVDRSVHVCIQACTTVDREESKTIRVSPPTHKKLALLREKVLRDGWVSVGADRTDAPTADAVIDAALTLLLERGKQ